MDIHNVRKMLAGMGAEIRSINNTFQDSDPQGNRATGDDIKFVDAAIRARLNEEYNPIQLPPVNQYLQEKQKIEEEFMMPYNSIYYQEQQVPQLSKSDRLNNYLGRTPKQIVVEPTNSKVLEISEGVSKAIAPLVETLEVLATLNGLLVQRLEQLILTVDPGAIIEGVNDTTENTEPAQNISDMFPENFQEMEVYDPEVSMSVLEEAENDKTVKPTKKTNRKTKA